VTRAGYRRAASATEVVQLLVDRGRRILAGGTDLLRQPGKPAVAGVEFVSLADLHGLDRIERRSDGTLRIGARATLADIGAHAEVRTGAAALAEAVLGAATPQIRNVATLAGNILQRPACEYFRTGHACLMAGGTGCPAREGDNAHHALFGGGPCVSAYPGDAAAALLALGARIRWIDRGGERDEPIAALHRLPEARRPSEIALPAEALITAVDIPAARGGGVGSAYLQARERATWAFALVGVAVRVVVAGGTIREAGVGMTGVAPIPWRSEEAEKAARGLSVARGRHFEEGIRRVAEAATHGARPLAGNGYKVTLVRTLTERALRRAVERAREAPARA
jgi:xanthine dehydrogenase YagS FAD-binding subunit